MRSLTLIPFCLLLAACPTEENPIFCDEEADCDVANGETCDLDGRFGPANVCVTLGEDCTVDACDPDSDAPICDMVLTQCRACMTGDSCPDGNICNPDSGRCEPAACDPVNNMCGSQAPVCGVGGQCTECVVGAGDADCAAHTEWPTPLPYCLDDGNGSTFCGECRDTDDCSDPAEVCNLDTNLCGPCTDHVQCASGACISGACQLPEDILYVDQLDQNANDAGSCTALEPCASITPALTLIGGGDTRSVLVVRGDINVTYIEALDIAVSATIIGEGANLMLPGASDNIPVVTVRSGAGVYLENMVIAGADGMDGADGVNCSGDSELHLKRVRIADNRGQGVDVISCTLTLERSYIGSNTRGGVQVQNSGFSIFSNYIVSNGNGFDNNFGGVLISNLGVMSPQLLDFNTIARNQTPVAGLSTGLSCTAAVGSPMDGYGNIIFEGLGADPVELSNCMLHYSNVETTLAEGDGNINAQPDFANPAQGNFHLLGPPGVDVDGLTCSNNCYDWDGDVRPDPTSGLADMGADEFYPAP